MNISSIRIYEDPAEIIKEAAPEYWESLSDAYRLELEHMNDFEEWKFAVIEVGPEVMVYVFSSIDGETSGEPMGINEFIENCVEGE